MFGVLVLGQIVSLLNTATGVTSSTLARKGIDAPTTQSFCNYLLLAIVYGTLHFFRPKKQQDTVEEHTVRWYYYLALVIIDVEANYSVVKAYQFTSLTSVMLLDCWTIPCVLLLTRAFLKTKYSKKQLVGAGVCVAGLVLVILSDAHAGDRTSGSHPLVGDALVLVASMLYAVSNVTEEFLIKKIDFIQVMAYLGSFGTVISAFQLLILERHELESIQWTPAAVLPFIAFALSMFGFYTLVPLLLKLSGSALLNLSLLTSDMWAVLIRIFIYHQKVDWLYYTAFVTVTVGLVIYSREEKRSSDEYTPVEDEQEQEPC